MPEIDDYNVVELLGRGGMGSVYKVVDKSLNRTMAIKVLKPELVPDHIAVKRFEQEAIAASKLTHPNLVAVFGHGKTKQGSPYLVMEYLDGESLSNLLARGETLNPSAVIDIFIQVCDALSHAHTKGVIHRDLTPGNIILTSTDSGAYIARVVDFGIAKVQHDLRSTQDLTETGSVLGSPSYMSPEQCLGLGLDGRGDVYSVGCVLFEALTGKALFPGENPVQIIAKHLDEEPVNLLKGETIPGALRDVIFTCIQKEKERRYESVVELGIDLQRIKDGKPPQFCLLSDDRIDQWSKKKPVIIGAISLLAVVAFSSISALLPQIDLFTWLRIFVSLSTGAILVVASIKIARIFLSATLRSTRLIDIVALCALLALIGNCVFCLAYCACALLNLSWDTVNATNNLLPSISLTVLFSSSYLVLRHYRFAEKELVFGRLDNRSSRSAIVVLSTILFLVVANLLLSNSLTSENLKPQQLESKWQAEHEIALLSKLIDQHTARSFNVDTSIVNQYRYIRSSLFAREGNMNASLRDLNKVIGSKGPYQSAALMDRALIEWCKGRPEAADRDATEVLKLDKTNRSAQLMKGLVALTRRDGKTAVQFFQQARKEKMTSTLLAFINFGYRLAGDKKRARQLLDESRYKTDSLIIYLKTEISAEDFLRRTPGQHLSVYQCLVAFDLAIKGRNNHARELFRDVVRRIDRSGYGWHQAIFYGLAKCELAKSK